LERPGECETVSARAFLDHLDVGLDKAIFGSQDGNQFVARNRTKQVSFGRAIRDLECLRH